MAERFGQDRAPSVNDEVAVGQIAHMYEGRTGFVAWWDQERQEGVITVSDSRDYDQLYFTPQDFGRLPVQCWAADRAASRDGIDEYQRAYDPMRWQ